MMIDPRAKLLAVLDHAEEYRGLALRAKDRGERESYERIVELYVEIAEELERCKKCGTIHEAQVHVDPMKSDAQGWLRGELAPSV